jgi:hypothetical protein
VLPEDTSLSRLVLLAHARWIIEQFYEDARASNVVWITSRVEASMDCIGIWLWSCWPTVSSCSIALRFLCLLERLFPPSVTRSSLPCVHRQVLLWLLHTQQTQAFRL